MFFRYVFLGLIVLLCGSCQTMRGQDLPVNETPQEQKESMKSVIGVIAGKAISDEDLKKIGKQIHEDPQAQSAVKAITDSLSGESVIIKYCPIDGARYFQDFKQCPEHKVDLKVLK